jgi:type II secretory pathway pseudopilin PulG
VTSHRATASPAWADERGFTLIEAIVGAMLLALVIAAASALFISGSDSSLAAQRESQLISAADQQIENVRQIVKTSGFSALGLSSLPAAASSATVKFSSSTPLDPNSYVTACGASSAYKIEANYDNSNEGLVSSLPVESPCTTAGLEPLVTGGTLPPNPPSVTVGSMTVALYEYVTQTNVGCNSSLGSGACTGDARRVIVVAVDSQAAARCSSTATLNRCSLGANAPVYLTTIFTNPTPSNAPNSAIGLTLGLQLG